MDTSEPRPARQRRHTVDEQDQFTARVVGLARELFAQGGYKAVSMRQVAARAGVAPMTLYSYFPGKAHLVRHLWDDILCANHQQAVQGLQALPDAHARLEVFLDRFLQYWLDHPDHHAAVFGARDETPEEARQGAPFFELDGVQRLLGTLVHLIDQCAGHPGADAAEWRGLVEMLSAKALGFTGLVLGTPFLPVQDVPALKRRMVADMVDQVRAAVAGRPSAPAG